MMLNIMMGMLNIMMFNEVRRMVMFNYAKKSLKKIKERN